jgi:hypothetical protein
LRHAIAFDKVVAVDDDLCDLHGNRNADQRGCLTKLSRFTNHNTTKVIVIGYRFNARQCLRFTALNLVQTTEHKVNSDCRPLAM